MRPKAATISEPLHQRVPVPLSLLRCPLFSVVDCEREYLRTLLPIDGVGLGASVRYTGPHLTQRHSLVWQAVLAAGIASGAKDGGTFHFTSDGLLRLIGAKSDTRLRRALHQTLEDLTRAHVQMKTRRVQFDGSLISGCTRDRKTGHLRITVLPEFMEAVRQEMLMNNLSRKVRFSKNYLAAWLHDCISSHQVVPRRTVSEIKGISGSVQPMNKFRARLRKAMNALTEGDESLVTRWEINRLDQLVIEKTKTPVKCNIRGKIVASETRFANQREKVSIDRARQVRAKVAL